MKKHLSYLIAVFCFLSMNQAQSADVLPSPATWGGYNAGAYNTTDIQNANYERIDKSYVQSLDEVTKDEQIYDATVEENYSREGSVYNPHFLLEKINFEGNTVKDISEKTFRI